MPEGAEEDVASSFIIPTWRHRYSNSVPESKLTKNVFLFRRVLAVFVKERFSERQLNVKKNFWLFLIQNQMAQTYFCSNYFFGLFFIWKSLKKFFFSNDTCFIFSRPENHAAGVQLLWKWSAWTTPSLWRLQRSLRL